MATYDDYIASLTSGTRGVGVPESGPFLQSLANLRTVEWGKTHNWDMRIPSAPSPFDSWFPASQIDRVLGNAAAKSLSVGPTDFSIPYSSSIKTISLTFHDDENAVLERWLEDWYNTTLVTSQGSVATLSEACREFDFVQLNNRRQLVDLVSLWVFPDGTFSSVRDSQGQSITHVCTFTVAARQYTPVIMTAEDLANFALMKQQMQNATNYYNQNTAAAGSASTGNSSADSVQQAGDDTTVQPGGNETTGGATATPPFGDSPVDGVVGTD